MKWRGRGDLTSLLASIICRAITIDWAGVDFLIAKMEKAPEI
ncbi:hypothetical protein pah_c022o035 [Parachlamydia acanthamoebae str. Hall's coccus]|nr:hypothetical protein pah_c022o035 [Parachlamydia acanthamoebae str. Hall's coccus]